MLQLMNVLRYLKSQKGQGLVEYLLLVCLIAIFVIGAIVVFRDTLYGMFIWIVGVLRHWCGC